jgi:hypothetical protein
LDWELFGPQGLDPGGRARFLETIKELTAQPWDTPAGAGN